MTRIVVELVEDLAATVRAHWPTLDNPGLFEVAQALRAQDPRFVALLHVFTEFDDAEHDIGAASSGGRSSAPVLHRLHSDPLIRRHHALASRSVTQRTFEPMPRPSEDFAGFFTVDVSQLPDDRKDAFLRALLSLSDVVRSAGFQPSYRGATGGVADVQGNGRVGAGEPELRPKQYYLDAIRAKPIDGGWDGLGFAEIDVGWMLDHEALAEFKNAWVFFPRAAPPPERDHGTRVLGVLIGGAKIRGIARGAMPKALIFHVEGDSLAGPLVEFLEPENDSLQYGDILLIEVEHAGSFGVTEGLPLEATSDGFRAVQNAVSAGVVVIEAAGNGRLAEGPWDLDEVARTPGAAPAWTLPQDAPPEVPLPDSGAVMVSACSMPLDPLKLPDDYQISPSVNFGSRVNCFGWGAGVLSCADPQEYRPDFNNTSSAAAMVAGIALVTQRLAKEKLGYVLSPLQMRTLLSDASCGTPVWSDTGYVGILPDLEKIARRLDQLPRVIVRAYPGDVGGVRDRAAVASGISPDIVLSDSAELGGGGEPRPVSARHARYLHVRARNIGDSHATRVLATAYWSADGDTEQAVWHELRAGATRMLRTGADAGWLKPIPFQLPPGVQSAAGVLDVVVAAGGSLDPRPLFPPARYRGTAGPSRTQVLDFVGENVNTAMRRFPLQ